MKFIRLICIICVAFVSVEGFAQGKITRPTKKVQQQNSTTSKPRITNRNKIEKQPQELPKQSTEQQVQELLKQSTEQQVQQLPNQSPQQKTQLTIQKTINGHEYIDLGLPSGVKWATCNVGASFPSDYGDYFAWGEIATKAEYKKKNSETFGKNFEEISGNPQYDAARYNWGGSWRLPSKAECEELKKKCTWTWTTQGGHKGYKVIGPNGNSIFLPATGLYNGTSHRYIGDLGNYWSSTSNESHYQYSYYLNFYSSLYRIYWYSRHYGFSIRPVSD